MATDDSSIKDHTVVSHDGWLAAQPTLLHEIGHLLLIGHSQFGIMQSGIQVQTNRCEWFTPTQGAAIRAVLVGTASGN